MTELHIPSILISKTWPNQAVEELAKTGSSHELCLKQPSLSGTKGGMTGNGKWAKNGSQWELGKNGPKDILER